MDNNEMKIDYFRKYFVICDNLVSGRIGLDTGRETLSELNSEFLDKGLSSDNLKDELIGEDIEMPDEWNNSEEWQSSQIC